jgi:hypothetical protein
LSFDIVSLDDDELLDDDGGVLVLGVDAAPEELDGGVDGVVVLLELLLDGGVLGAMVEELELDDGGVVVDGVVVVEDVPLSR